MGNNLSKRLKNFATAIIVLTTISSFGQKQDVRKPAIVPINEAIEKGLLDVNISGVFDNQTYREVIDRDGVHYGKCMAIMLTSNIDSLVLLKIDCGTELIPNDSSFQTMIVTKTVELPLPPNRTYLTRFYAMCGEIHDAPPFHMSTYKVGLLADSNTVKLAQYFDDNFIQNLIGQHALWAYADQVDSKELEKYGADSLSLALTTKILNDLSIKTTLNSEEQRVAILPNNTFELSKDLVYGTGTLILLLLASLIYLMRRNRKGVEINT